MWENIERYRITHLMLTDQPPSSATIHNLQTKAKLFTNVSDKPIKPPLTPPWEVIVLVSRHLDPKSLAIASCVSKSWNNCMSSDQFWQPICTTQYRSLSNLKRANPLVPYKRLFATAYVASKRRIKGPSKPRISIDSLVFTISASTCGGNEVFNLAKPCFEMVRNYYDVFKFEVNVNHECLVANEALVSLNVTWNVVLTDWKSMFTMMDCQGNTRLAPEIGGGRWFSEELPSPGCCYSEGTSGLIADVKLGFCGGRNSEGGKVGVNKLTLGILSGVKWRYVSVDDGLRYLQHFLAP